MNKNILIGLALIVAAGAGYYAFGMKPHAAEEAAEAAIEAAPAVDDAAAATAAAAKVAADAATKAAADAAAATQAAAEAAAEAAARAAADAAAAVTTAATETTAAATTEAVTAATAMADDTMALLDPANFDATKINAMIEASELTSVVKATLKSGVDAAAAEPAKITEALAAIKTALGL